MASEANARSKPPMDFDNWMKAVDSAVDAYCGLSVADLPDCTFCDWYDDGMSPSRAAKRAIKNARE